MTKDRLSPSKEINKLVRIAKKEGWRVEKTKNSHILFYPPDLDSGFVTMPSTPRSSRNFKNYVNELKMRGLNV